MKTMAQWDKRIIVALLAMVLIAVVFWLGSRYPALNEKALMGVESPISGLAFNALITVLPDSNVVWRATLNFVNWIYTNWRGMSFGILFGAALLTILPLLQRLFFDNRFANAMLGVFIGAPMGVCVNCAAPIAKGLHRAGTRFETTIGALIASPTLNVIVLSISFALLPVYMAITKVVLTVLFILLIVPLLGIWAGRLAPKTQTVVAVAPNSRWSHFTKWWEFNSAPVPVVTGANNRLLPALRWYSINFLHSLRFLALTTVPMMLAAGLIGAIMITAVPLQSLVASFELAFQGPLLTIVGLILLSCFAILLPVPIAFDVIVVAIMMGAGLDVTYAMVLLIALGGYSMVAFLIVGQSISYRVAAVLGGAMALLAVVGGIAGHYGYKWDQEQQLRLIVEGISDIPGPRGQEISRPPGLSAAKIAGLVAPYKITLEKQNLAVSHQGPGSIEVFSVELPASNQSNGPIFARVIGPDIGLAEPRSLSDTYAFSLAAEMNTTAAGDVNGDGWVDLVFNSDTTLGGIGLYINKGGEYLRQTLDLGAVNSAVVGAVALVDLDNDGQLDLYISTYAQGNFVFYNQNGSFDVSRQIKLPDTGSVLTAAPAFADLDGDGALDIVQGNWSAGNVLGSGKGRKFAQKSARDWILWNDADGFTPQKLPGLPGQTLTSLVWDINRDGLPDILIGDDFAPSDKLYLNQGKRDFRLTTKSDGMLPYLLNTTMSFDFGDIDNDQIPEFYGVQISKSDTNDKVEPRLVCKQLFEDGSITSAQRKECFKTLVYLNEAVRRSSSGRSLECNQIDTANGRGLCRVFSYFRIALQDQDPARCARLPESWGHVRQICEQVSGPGENKAEIRAFNKTAVGSGPKKSNILFAYTKEGKMTDIGATAAVQQPGWGWNSRFVDLDQDGLQDIFVVTGRAGQKRFTTNVFYQNQGARKFAQRQQKYGLTDVTPSTSFVTMDYDRDGDVDIIRGPTISSSIVHRNDRPKGSALWIRLQDEIGNSKGIGATILVTVGGMTLRRDIKASGGFASTDAPSVHFGIGTEGKIQKIEIIWRDGSRSEIAGPLKGQTEFLIRRAN